MKLVDYIEALKAQLPEEIFVYQGLSPDLISSIGDLYQAEALTAYLSTGAPTLGHVEYPTRVEEWGAVAAVAASLVYATERDLTAYRLGWALAHGREPHDDVIPASAGHPLPEMMEAAREIEFVMITLTEGNEEQHLLRARYAAYRVWDLLRFYCERWTGETFEFTLRESLR